MRLKHITFTGIDAKTDIKALQDLWEECDRKNCEFTNGNDRKEDEV